MFRKILVAVDGSEASNKAVEWAKQAYTDLPHATFTFVHVYQPYIPVVGTDGYIPISYDPVNLQIPEDTPSFQAWSQFSGKERLHFVNLLGNASDAICKEALEGGYDLIVIGAEGHGVVSSVLLGSVSGKVLHHAKCSVLIIR